MQIRAPLTATECVINKNIDTNKPLIIGVDEVGRGCLFGQMTVCACVLPPEFAQDLTDKFGHNNLQDTMFEQLGDSKKTVCQKTYRIGTAHQNTSKLRHHRRPCSQN